MIRLLPALLALCLAWPAAAAPTTLPNGVTLDLPTEGWERREAKGGATLLQKKFAADADNKGGGAMISLIGPVGGGFEANVAGMFKSIPELATQKPTTKKAGKTVNGHAIRMEYRCCARRESIRMDAHAVGIDAGGKQYFAMLLEINTRGERSKALEAEFEAMIRSLRPTSGDRAFALEPPKGSGGLEGVFTTLHTGLMPNAFGGMDFQAESRIMAFDPAGLYATELPRGGASLADHCRKKPTDCGTYRLVGGGLLSSPSQIELSEVANSFGMIETAAKPFARDGRNLKLDKTVWKQVPPLPRGTPYEGSWTYSWASSGMTATSSGGVSSQRTLRMTRSGEFWRTGYTGVMSSHETGGTRTSVAGGNQRPAEHGRYQVEGYTMTLTGDDGQVQVMSLFQPDGKEQGLLVLDGGNYLNRKTVK